MNNDHIYMIERIGDLKSIEYTHTQTGHAICNELQMMGYVTWISTTGDKTTWTLTEKGWAQYREYSRQQAEAKKWEKALLINCTSARGEHMIIRKLGEEYQVVTGGNEPQIVDSTHAGWELVAKWWKFNAKHVIHNDLRMAALYLRAMGKHAMADTLQSVMEQVLSL